MRCSLIFRAVRSRPRATTRGRPYRIEIQPSFFGNPVFAYIPFGCNFEFRIPNYELMLIPHSEFRIDLSVSSRTDKITPSVQVAYLNNITCFRRMNILPVPYIHPNVMRIARRTEKHKIPRTKKCRGKCAVPIREFACD